MWKKAVVAYFKVVLRHFFLKNDEILLLVYSVPCQDLHPRTLECEAKEISPNG